jgi:hypothetical protein
VSGNPSYPRALPANGSGQWNRRSARGVGVPARWRYDSAHVCRVCGASAPDAQLVQSIPNEQSQVPETTTRTVSVATSRNRTC